MDAATKQNPQEAERQWIRERLAERLSKRISFVTYNFFGIPTYCTGWLVSYFGHNFFRVWSDAERAYVPVHRLHIVSGF